MSCSPEAVTFLGHATCRLDVGGARLLTDPFLRDRLGHLTRRSAPVPRDAYAELDAVLLSHLHLDHFDVPSLRRLDRGVRVLVPRGGGALLRRLGFAHVQEVRAGQRVLVGGAEVLVVPAEHDGRRRPGGMTGDTLGYVVTGDATVYFAGDTDLHPEMEALPRLDLALLPVWGWGPTLGAGHLDPEAAAQALVLLRPRIAVPIHWGTLFPVGLGRWRGDRLTEPPREFARHAAALAPEVRGDDPRARLEPGARTCIALHRAQQHAPQPRDAEQARPDVGADDGADLGDELGVAPVDRAAALDDPVGYVVRLHVLDEEDVGALGRGAPAAGRPSARTRAWTCGRARPARSRGRC